MRTFSCFTFDDHSTVPELSFIFADDEARVRLLVRRELLKDKGAISVEICEDGKLLWTVMA